MSLKERLRIGVSFSMLQNTLEGLSGNLKIHLSVGERKDFSLQPCSSVQCLLRAEGRYSLESLG